MDNDWYNELLNMFSLADIPQLEERLNEMWANYGRGNPEQLIIYNEQVKEIKTMGKRVYRNSQGKHKILGGE